MGGLLYNVWGDENHFVVSFGVRRRIWVCGFFLAVADFRDRAKASIPEVFCARGIISVRAIRLAG